MCIARKSITAAFGATAPLFGALPGKNVPMAGRDHCQFSRWAALSHQVGYEAMACDVPCVATKIGDSAEIVGEYGRIVPQRDPDALAGAWRAQLGKEQRFAVGEVRAQVTARCSLKQMCAHYKSLYRSLAQKRQERDYH